MAANISITKEAGPLNHNGASSTRKIAAPRLKGIAISKPIAELNNVPKIAGRAPNTLRTASQDELPIKENPNLFIAGIAFIARTITRLKRIPTIIMAKINVELEKILSAKWVLGLYLQLLAFISDFASGPLSFINLKLFSFINGKCGRFYPSYISAGDLYSFRLLFNDSIMVAPGISSIVSHFPLWSRRWSAMWGN